jgi:3-isopropylmalate dehydrogenase
MMLRYSLAQPELADRVGLAVQSVLDDGLRTIDIQRGAGESVGTEQMGKAVLSKL